MVASTELVIGVDGSAAASADAVRWGPLEAIRQHAPVELITTKVFVPASYSSVFKLRGAVSTDAKCPVAVFKSGGVDPIAVHAWSHLELGSVCTRDGDSEQWWNSDLNSRTPS